MRPLKYGEEMIRVDLRIPKSSADAFKILVKEFLKKYENGGKITNSVKTPKLEKGSVTSDRPKWQIDAENRNKRTKE